MKSISVALVFLCWFWFSYGGEVPLVNLCPSELGGRVVSFQVTDCNALPCTFVRDRTYRIVFVYSPGKNATIQRIKCGSVIFNQPQTIADFDACDGLSQDNRCPVVAGQNYTYDTNVKITPPATGTYTVWCDIMDENGFKQICVKGNAKIVMW